MNKPMQCPKCGNARFGYNPRYQSYCCPSCKHEDKTMLLPSEQDAFIKFKKFMALYLGDGGTLEVQAPKVETFSYDKFKELMNRYITEEVRPAQEAAEEASVEEEVKPKKRGRKPKNDG